MDKDFYKRALRIAIPIMIQNGITNFVAMLDNIMIGQIGTNQMSSVAIVNQLMFVFNLCIFGGLSGIGIFTAQFYGKKDHNGIRHCFRLMFILACLLSLTGMIVFLTNGSRLISLYLSKGDALTSAEDTLFYAKQYLQIMLIGMLPFALTQVYSSTLRSTNETIIPMRGSMLAVFVNLIGNYILIYGKFGFPVLGVRGAAIATALSRFVELAFVAVWTHSHKEKTYLYRMCLQAFLSQKILS
ncbi:MAG: polysaccharide biosynthesis C-terminal domain-containing protein [Solobacterium sp.]|nr:polysaccharide biosynthesis C-terminal domain-containing protein [Solobacterium sp.]